MKMFEEKIDGKVTVKTVSIDEFCTITKPRSVLLIDDSKDKRGGQTSQEMEIMTSKIVRKMREDYGALVLSTSLEGALSPLISASLEQTILFGGCCCCFGSEGDSVDKYLSLVKKFGPKVTVATHGPLREGLSYFLGKVLPGESIKKSIYLRTPLMERPKPETGGFGKILVVEDQERHREDVRRVLELSPYHEKRWKPYKEGDGSYDIVGSLEDAKKLFSSGKYEGVLSDVFFPRTRGGVEEQLGTEFGQYVLDRGIPLVLVTSTYHHGRKTQPACDWARKRGMQLIDRPDMSSSTLCESEDEHKEWEGAYFLMSYLMEAKKAGMLEITPLGIKEGSEWPKYKGRERESLMLDVVSPIERFALIRSYIGDKYGERLPLFRETLEKYCFGMSLDV